MRVLFYWHTPNLGAKWVTESMQNGIKFHGDSVSVRPLATFQPEQIREADVVFTHTVGFSRPVLEACQKYNVTSVYYDKGYFSRAWKAKHPQAYVRFSVNRFQPIEYLMHLDCPDDRWKDLKIELKPRQQYGENVVFAGCTQAMADWYNFDISEYAHIILSEVQKHTKKPVVYRPKKSLTPPKPIPGTIYSHYERKIQVEIQQSSVVITFSSNAAVDALINGVPAITLGPSIAYPVTPHDLNCVDDTPYPEGHLLKKWLYNLAYCQWRFDEMECGKAWEEIKRLIPISRQYPRQDWTASPFLTK